MHSHGGKGTYSAPRCSGGQASAWAKTEEPYFTGDAEPAGSARAAGACRRAGGRGSCLRRSRGRADVAGLAPAHVWTGDPGGARMGAVRECGGVARLVPGPQAVRAADGWLAGGRALRVGAAWPERSPMDGRRGEFPGSDPRRRHRPVVGGGVPRQAGVAQPSPDRGGAAGAGAHALGRGKRAVLD